MSSVPSLPLSAIFPVSVVIAPQATPGQTFNQGLFVGPTAVIATVPGQSTYRIQAYASLTAMLQAGFLDTDPEYIAAELYFAQNPSPSIVWIGRQNLTSIAQITAVSGSLGTLYVVGDILTVTQSGASVGTVMVTAVTAGGVVAYAATTGTGTSGSTTLTLADATGAQVGMTITGAGIAEATTITALVSTTATLSQPLTANLSTTAVVLSGLAVQSGGTGYAVANGLSTTGGTGTGAEVDIIAIGETPVQAIEACRIVQSAWYQCMFVGSAQDADHEAIALYIEAATPPSMYFLTSGAAAILNNTTPNLFSILQSEKYTRTFMMYSTTQGGIYPNNIYASAGVMGKANGLNTGAPNSYFALMFKSIAGIGPEPLTQTQVVNICGSATRSQLGFSGNAYVNYQNGAYEWVQFGLMASGNFFDEIMNLDMIVNDMQTSGVNLLVDVPSVPVTNSGVTEMINVLVGAMVRSQNRGFVAPSGTWLGQNIGTGNGAITTGQPLPNGYAFYAPPVSTLSSAQLAARQLPPISAALIESGSAVSLSVTINVQA